MVIFTYYSEHFSQLPTAPCRVFMVTALLRRSPAACRGLEKRLPFLLDKAHYSARRDRQQVLPVTPQNISQQNITRITERNMSKRIFDINPNIEFFLIRYHLLHDQIAYCSALKCNRRRRTYLLP
jgi:hypothetical protein